MSLGLPIVVTDVPALVEAAAGYEGCLFVPVHDVERLRDALLAIAELRGTRYLDPTSWDETVSRYELLFSRMGLLVENPVAKTSPYQRLTDQGAVLSRQAPSPADG